MLEKANHVTSIKQDEDVGEAIAGPTRCGVQPGEDAIG
jgi:hypothetical protein